MLHSNKIDTVNCYTVEMQNTIPNKNTLNFTVGPNKS